MWAFWSFDMKLESDRERYIHFLCVWHGMMASLHSTIPKVMASSIKKSFDRWAIDLLSSSSPPTAQTKQNPLPVLFPTPISRRSALLFSWVVPLTLIPVSPPSMARERRSRKTIPPEDYITACKSSLPPF